MQPFMTCLCPTWKRPKLLANAVACFERQTYPAELRELLILDDAGQYRPQAGEGWSLATTRSRYPHLPEKFNRLVEMSSGSTTCGSAGRMRVFCVWEDDDIYLPWHLEAHALAIQAGASYSKPSRVWSTYPGHMVEEQAAGRFHGSLAVRAELLNWHGGWPDTPRADFDQTLMSGLASMGIPGDPCEHLPPSYVFRWKTGAYHGQAKMTGPDDSDWYMRCADEGDAAPVDVLVPAMDEETQRIYRSFGF